MVFVKKMQTTNGFDSYSIKSLFSKDFHIIIDFMSLSMGSRNPVTYLKDEKTDNMIKMEFIDGHIVKSYMLDLFDFKSEFKGLIE